MTSKGLTPMAITVLCTRCGINEVPMPDSIEVDPLCEVCQAQLNNPHSIAHPENLAEFEKEVLAISNTCPGWGTGEDCGNPRMAGGDLCGDCHGARLNFESPYPGNHRQYPC